MNDATLTWSESQGAGVLLAALVHHLGGSVTVPRDTFASLDAKHGDSWQVLVRKDEQGSVVITFGTKEG